MITKYLQHFYTLEPPIFIKTFTETIVLKTVALAGRLFLWLSQCLDAFVQHHYTSQTRDTGDKKVSKEFDANSPALTKELLSPAEQRREKRGSQERRSPSPVTSEPLFSVETPRIQIQYEETHLTQIVSLREPLISYLRPFFELDAAGYILSLQKGLELETVISQLSARSTVEQMAPIFKQVAQNGDAGYAHDLRTTLAHWGIGSIQISKVDGKELKDPVRPHSYLKNRKGTQDPPTDKEQPPVYMSLWERAIQQGHNEFRRSSESTLDKTIPIAQLIHYQRSLKEILDLHASGDLCIRCTHLKEATDFIQGHYLMAHNILATTLIPSAFSKISMGLITEFGGITLGLLLNPKRVHKNDFGASYYGYASLIGAEFVSHKQQIGEESAGCYEACKQLLKDFEACQVVGEDLRKFRLSISEDHQRWIVLQSEEELPNRWTQPKSQLISNKQTFYRPLENDLFCGFFILKNSANFVEELQQAMVLQNQIREETGRFLPIVSLDMEKNRIEELLPDPISIKILGLQGKVVPQIGQISRFGSTLESAGITEVMAQQIAEALSSKNPTIQRLLSWQIVILYRQNLMDPIDVKEQLERTNYFYNKAPILENLHLIFPTIQLREDLENEESVLCFSLADVEEIRASFVLLPFLQQALKSHLHRFLGIKQTLEGKIGFNPRILSRFDVGDKKNADFVKALAYALRSIILFDVFGEPTKDAVIDIVQTIRKQIPHLGIMPSGVDLLLGSQKMQSLLRMREFPDFVQGCMALEMVRASSVEDIEIPSLDFKFQETIHPFGNFSLPPAQIFYEFLGQFGLDFQTKRFDFTKFHFYFPADRYLERVESVVGKALQWLLLIAPQDGEWALSAIRNVYPTFGFSAAGEDLVVTYPDRLIRWLEEQKKGEMPTTEFPFALDGSDLIEQESSVFISANKFSRDPALLVRYNKLVGIIGQEDPRHCLLKKLGLLSLYGTPLWNIRRSRNKKLPHLNLRDLLGIHYVELLSGPAFYPAVIEQDCQTAEITLSASLTDQVPRLLTHILAVNTDGDRYRLRQNGSESRDEFPLSLIEEIAEDATDEEKALYRYDQQLLSKDEIRVKQRSLLKSAWITVTAQYGLTAPRCPLEKAYRVLYLNTAAPQFDLEAFEHIQDRYFDTLIVPTIQRRMKDKSIYLKATFFGGEALTRAGGVDLRMKGVHAMMLSYTRLIRERTFKSGSVIEFFGYGELEQLNPELKRDLLAEAKDTGVHIVWSPEGDVFDFAPKTTLSNLEVNLEPFEESESLICLGDTNVMAFDGNASETNSIESMMGNNSNLRVVMNVHSNKNWLDPQRIQNC